MRSDCVAAYGKRRPGRARDGLAVAVPLVTQRAVIGRGGLHLQRARLAQVQRNLRLKIGGDDGSLRRGQHVHRRHLAPRHRGQASRRGRDDRIDGMRAGGKRRREARIRRALDRSAVNVPLHGKRRALLRRGRDGERRHRAARLHRHRRRVQIGGDDRRRNAVRTGIGRQVRGIAHLGAHRGAIGRGLPVDGRSARPILQHRLAAVGVLLHEAIFLRTLDTAVRLRHQRIHAVLGNAPELERRRERAVLLELLGRVGTDGLERRLRHVVAVRAGRGVHGDAGRVGGVAGQVERGQRTGNHQHARRAGLVELQAGHALAEVGRLLVGSVLRVGIAAALPAAHDQVRRRVALVALVVGIEVLAERVGLDVLHVAAQVHHVELFGEAVRLDGLQAVREHHVVKRGALERVVADGGHALGNLERPLLRRGAIHQAAHILAVHHAVERRVVRRVIGHVDLLQAEAPRERAGQITRRQLATDGDLLEALAILEQLVFNACDAIGHGEACQAQAAGEAAVADRLHALAQRHGRDEAIAREHALAQVLHGAGNHQVACALSADIGAGERAVGKLGQVAGQAVGGRTLRRVRQLDLGEEQVAGERVRADGLDVVGHLRIIQAALAERAARDGTQAIGQVHAGQAHAALERRFADGGQAFGQHQIAGNAAVYERARRDFAQLAGVRLGILETELLGVADLRPAVSSGLRDAGERALADLLHAGGNPHMRELHIAFERGFADLGHVVGDDDGGLIARIAVQHVVLVDDEIVVVGSAVLDGRRGGLRDAVLHDGGGQRGVAHLVAALDVRGGRGAFCGGNGEHLVVRGFPGDGAALHVVGKQRGKLDRIAIFRGTQRIAGKDDALICGNVRHAHLHGVGERRVVLHGDGDGRLALGDAGQRAVGGHLRRVLVAAGPYQLGIGGVGRRQRRGKRQRLTRSHHGAFGGKLHAGGGDGIHHGGLGLADQLAVVPCIGAHRVGDRFVAVPVAPRGLHVGDLHLHLIHVVTIGVLRNRVAGHQRAIKAIVRRNTVDIGRHQVDCRHEGVVLRRDVQHRVAVVVVVRDVGDLGRGGIVMNLELLRLLLGRGTGGGRRLLQRVDALLRIGVAARIEHGRVAAQNALRRNPRLVRGAVIGFTHVIVAGLALIGAVGAGHGVREVVHVAQQAGGGGQRGGRIGEAGVRYDDAVGIELLGITLRERVHTQVGAMGGVDHLRADEVVVAVLRGVEHARLRPIAVEAHEGHGQVDAVIGGFQHGEAVHERAVGGVFAGECGEFVPAAHGHG